MRIDDPATKAAVGVMDGTIGIAAIQRLTDAFTQRTGAEFRILNADGSLVAETESEHARDRTVKLSPETMSREGWRIGVGSTGHSGGSRDARVALGWVPLADAEGPHRDMIVIAERREDGAAGRIGGIMVAVIALAVVVGMAGGVWLRRRLAGRLGELADAMERLSDGDVRTENRAEGNDEIARIVRGVEKVRGTIRRALQFINRQSG